MSRRRAMQQRRHNMSEITNIMNSMKTLAYLENRKLSRFVSAQQAVVNGLEKVAQDFLFHHPQILPETAQGNSLIIILGSERGFCGNFNHSLKHRLSEITKNVGEHGVLLISVGHKMQELLHSDSRLVARIDGASIAEEVTHVLDQLAGEISKQQHRQVLRVMCLYHSGDNVTEKQLLPPFRHIDISSAEHRYPPALNLTPADFFTDLADHYLFSVLHAMLYTSLMMENRHRVNHLEYAAGYIEKQVGELDQKINRMRQEEIIEEIEVLLLYCGQGES